MNATVLIVDDSLTVRMDLAEAFENAGLKALHCNSAAQARELLGRGGVDAIVLDVLLPDGDGVSLLAEIRSSTGGVSIPVLMLSTEAEVRDRARALKTGADEFVGKPYDRGYVVSKAQELLRERRATATTPSNVTTVLIVDDSPTYREELREAFERAGYSVLVAASGEEGLRIAADRRPSAIVVDGMMPGLDGATVIRHVRLDAALRGIPCLLFTASEDRHAELTALDAGADAFVRKEEDVEVVLAKVAAVLRRPVLGPGSETVSLTGPRRILAVDDSATYLQELSEALRGEGYDVIQARSGEEALELLALQTVDCVLLDLVMPGLGGTETCRRIKNAPIVRDTPLIMLTALEDRTAMIEGLGAGADDYISKSSDFDVLRARVRAQIRRKQFEDENRRIREHLVRSELEAAEARNARRLSEAKAALSEELARKNQELEAFSYSVSHDLRAPLRGIDGFSQALLEDCGDRLDDVGRQHLARVRAATQRMGELIDDLLELSRVSRATLSRDEVKLSELVRAVAEELGRREPLHQLQLVVGGDLSATGDRRLLRVLIENLVGNAWKFSSKSPQPRIEVGSERQADQTVFFVRDNGAGFDMAYASKLFSPFQRLHTEAEFPGTGIGLATVRRIVDRHGGRTWAEGKIGQGATVFFTLPEPPVEPAK